MIWWQILIVCVVSYFIGNISFGRFVAKMEGRDITKVGSGNAGTTNVLRNMGLKYGALTLLLDGLKGYIPAIACYYIFGHSLTMLYIAGVSTIVGHIFPVVYKFKGGKGMATMLGVFFAGAPIASIISCFVAYLCWLAFSYGSLACFWLVTSLTVSQGLRVKHTLPSTDAKIICILLFSIFLLTWFAERGNIQRLMVGTEGKVDLTRTTKKKMKLK